MYISIRGVISIIALLLISWGESQVSLSRTSPPETSSVCPNATAVFTCRVTGSSTLVWTSPGYIPTTVEFTVHNMRGKIKNETDDVVANLTEISGNILESELRIRASVNSSISCLPDDANSGETATLTVYNDFPGRVINVSAEPVEKDPTSDVCCTILVEWDPPTDTPPEDIDHYIIRDSGDRVLNKTNATSALVTVPLIGECTNNLSISITTVDRCGGEGHSSDDVELKCLLPSTTPATDASTPSGTISTTTTNTPNGTAPTSPAMIAIIISSSIGSIVVIFVIAVVVTVIIYYYCVYRRRLKVKATHEVHDGADSDVSTENEIELAVSSGPPPPPPFEKPQDTAETDGVMLKRRRLRAVESSRQ